MSTTKKSQTHLKQSSTTYLAIDLTLCDPQFSSISPEGYRKIHAGVPISLL